MKPKEAIATLIQQNKSEGLLTPIAYDNPDRKEDVFYEFIREYAKSLNISIKERSIGLIDEKKGDIRTMRQAIFDSEISTSTRVFHGITSLLELVLTPIKYPLVGPSGSVTTDDEEQQVVVDIPHYKGLQGLLFSDTPHEYIHIYHFLVATDLKAQGLLPNIDGYKDLGIVEPGVRVPTKKELKKFEKKILTAMIRKEIKLLLKDK